MSLNRLHLNASKPVYINTSPFLRLLRPLQRQISVYKHFSGAEKVCINTSPAPERCFQVLLRLLRHRKVYLKTSPAPGKYFYIIYFSDTSPAPEKPGKYLKTP